ncbi:hypothetical protein AAG570_013643 [Ranatra chinensis]|uniref:Major facilitator superfamily (MFS) profile domain-containing protein n=1 Tax=Ranatra chinensis TaxID=642074 RepID=A0ABD0YRJ7_9HEMI
MASKHRNMFYENMSSLALNSLVNLIDLSPKYAGFIGSVGNGVGTLAGVLVPIVNGVLTPNEMTYIRNCTSLIVTESVRQRNTMTVLLYLGLAASRVLLRVLHTELGKMTYIPPVRPHPCQNGRYEMEEHKDYQFSWTVGLQTILSVSLFFGGAVTALAGGLACQRHGAAPVMGGGLAISSVLALFTPLILNSLDWPGMLFIRIAIGHCLVGI